MVLVNAYVRCKVKPSLFSRAIKMLGVRGVSMVGEFRYLMALLRFSTDLLIKRSEDKIYAVSYYIPGDKPLIVKLNEFGETFYLMFRPKSG